jgi:hypothetical protein
MDHQTDKERQLRARLADAEDLVACMHGRVAKVQGDLAELAVHCLLHEACEKTRAHMVPAVEHLRTELGEALDLLRAQERVRDARRDALYRAFPPDCKEVVLSCGPAPLALSPEARAAFAAYAGEEYAPDTTPRHHWALLRVLQELKDRALHSQWDAGFEIAAVPGGVYTLTYDHAAAKEVLRTPGNIPWTRTAA